jgi:phosphoglycolate phosphatase
MASKQHLCAALIDLDGTLVDSAPELADSLDVMLTELGHARVGEERVRQWVGGGVGVLVEQGLHHALGREPTDAERDEGRTRFRRAYDKRVGHRGPVYPGVVTGLERFRAHGLRLACVTNKIRRFTVPMLERLDLMHHFDAVVAGDDAGALKPDPAALLLAADRLGVDPGHCIMIGDSAIDVAAARNAGMPVWCLRSGYGGSEPVDAAGPDAAFDRFDELAEALVVSLGRED